MKLLKVFSIITIAIMLLASASNIVLATGLINPSEIKGNTTGALGVQTLGQSVIGVLQTVGSVVAVVILVVIGVKYMMGSAEEKAEYKKTLIPYVVGAVLIFAAPYIAGWVFEWASSIQ